LKVNGLKSSYFYHQWGLRQRDPLSPLFFIIATDTLQTLMQRTSQNLISLSNFQMTMLQFADDTVIITLAHTKNLKLIKVTLQIFRQASGLKINLYKSGFLHIVVPEKTYTHNSSYHAMPKNKPPNRLPRVATNNKQTEQTSVSSPHLQSSAKIRWVHDKTSLSDGKGGPHKHRTQTQCHYTSCRRSCCPHGYSKH
jgi:Reverse transcriptase (RNA-dependent DNA polymerase)